MKGQITAFVHRPNLLRVLLKIHEWETSQLDALQTLSGRALYLCLAASLLDDAKPQSLKFLQGHMTERSLRQRMHAFEMQGLIEVASNQVDRRTKSIRPTELFIRNLNQHLDLLMHVCEHEFLMIAKK